MTEAEWLACENPREMLDSLLRQDATRKLRLFACGCYRQLAAMDTDLADFQVVEVSEGVADGRLPLRTLRDLHNRLGARGGFSTAWAAENAASATLEESAQTAAVRASEFAFHFRRYHVAELARSEKTVATEPDQSSHDDRHLALTPLLRDIFGNPFHPVAIDPAWLTSTVVALARGIYDDRAFDRMPILADALEDAGCDNADILAHCRDADAIHVRGCWVVDLVLGKE